MFGNASPQPLGPWERNGFRSLATLDSNADGEITSKDSHYDELFWWTDRNHDGVNQFSEMERVTESLSTKYKTSRHVDEYGNQFRYRAKAGNNWMVDVFLLVRP